MRPIRERQHRRKYAAAINHIARRLRDARAILGNALKARGKCIGHEIWGGLSASLEAVAQCDKKRRAKRRRRMAITAAILVTGLLIAYIGVPLLDWLAARERAREGLSQRERINREIDRRRRI